MDIIVTSEDKLKALVQEAVSAAMEKHLPPSEQNSEAPPEIIGTDEAAVILGCSKSNVYEKTSKGKIPHYKRDKKLYFLRSELIAWILGGRQGTYLEEKQAFSTYLNRKEQK